MAKQDKFTVPAKEEETKEIALAKDDEAEHFDIQEMKKLLRRFRGYQSLYRHSALS